MGVWEGFKGVVVFLTVLPVPSPPRELSPAARHMYFFPVVGAFIGAVAGLASWGLLQLLPPTLAGVLTVGVLMLMTGLHHVDGLLDFGDGAMVRGPPAARVAAMRDEKTGVGGWSLGAFTLLATAFAVGSLGAPWALPGLVVAEVSAKFAMVMVAGLGRLGSPGAAAPFIEAMRGRLGSLRLALAGVLALAFTFPLGSALAAAGLAGGILTGLVVLAVATRMLGGLTGDVFGACNELSRLGSLLFLVAAG